MHLFWRKFGSATVNQVSSSAHCSGRWCLQYTTGIIIGSRWGSPQGHSHNASSHHTTPKASCSEYPPPQQRLRLCLCFCCSNQPLLTSRQTCQHVGASAKHIPPNRCTTLLNLHYSALKTPHGQGEKLHLTTNEVRPIEQPTPFPHKLSVEGKDNSRSNRRVSNLSEVNTFRTNRNYVQ